MQFWAFLQGLWYENPSFSRHILCAFVPAFSVVLSQHIHSPSSPHTYTIVLHIPLFLPFIHILLASSFYLYHLQSWHSFFFCSRIAIFSLSQDLFDHFYNFLDPLYPIDHFLGLNMKTFRIPTLPKSLHTNFTKVHCSHLTRLRFSGQS